VEILVWVPLTHPRTLSMLMMRSSGRINFNTRYVANRIKPGDDDE